MRAAREAATSSCRAGCAARARWRELAGESRGLIRAALPWDLPVQLDETKLGWGPIRRAQLRYLDGGRDQELPLVYCPLAQADVLPGLPSAEVDLDGPWRGKRRWIWNEKSW